MLSRAKLDVSSEKQKMLAGENYRPLDSALTQERASASKLLHQFNQTQDFETQKREELLKKLFGVVGEGSEVKTTLKCDYGYNIKIGSNVFINYNCILLDCNVIEIGDDTLLATGVQILTAHHPTNPNLRKEKLEAASPVVIGSNVWIGAGAIICPGVIIGDNTTIGAGSVVTKDIPSNVVAVGNPCRVIRSV